MVGTAVFVGKTSQQKENYMINEQLSPDFTTLLLEKRLKQLETTLSKIKQETNFQLNDHVRIHQKGKYVEYYQLCKERTNYGNYILLKDTKAASRLAQNDYNKKIIKLLQKEINAIKLYFIRTKASALLKLYTNMTPTRQKLITPVTLTNEQYSQQWLSVSWQGLPFTEDNPELYTSTGVRVRSKSEVLIADALTRHDIPYRYEYPLSLKVNAKPKILHPDFMCLNVRTRQEFYWEHFGLMDSPEYANNSIGKFRLFTDNRLTPGANLIITMESKNEPLTTRTVETMIKTYLK